MVFSSIIFLFFFLPAVVLISALLPGKAKNPFLLLASLFFYAWGEPKYVFLMIATVLAHYLLARGIERFHESKKRQRALLILAITLSLGSLCLFKYMGGFIGLALPIGISFYTFQTLSYTIDVYKGRICAVKNIVDLSTYICLFPQLIAGPIVRYTDIIDDIKERVIDADKLFNGLFRFSIGLAKKVLLANQIGLIFDEIKATASNAPSVILIIGALAFTFQIYFDFSGYSDMAIGIGQMLGFKFPENFRYPYESRSITEFWRRWHITLSSWFRDYLYIPLGGSKKGISRQIINLFIVWSLTGLWHGAGVNFLLWGIYYFIFLVLEKFILKNLLDKLPSVIQRIYALIIIVFGWVIFACDNPALLLNYISGLFGKNGIFSDYALYLLSSYKILFVLLIAGSTHLPATLGGLVMKKVSGGLGNLLKSLFMILLLFISIAFLLGDSYNPFLYFRF